MRPPRRYRTQRTDWKDSRTVVYRGFLDGDSDHLTFVTDARSSKIEDLAHEPRVEICWYFPQTRDQYRIAGSMEVVGAKGEAARQAQRNAAWQRMSDNARQQFLWPHPGLPRPDIPENDALFEVPAPTAEEPVGDNFCLLVLEPSEVDHLSLKQNKRWRYRKAEGGGEGGAGWTEEYLNP